MNIYLMGNECITKAHDANAAIRCFDKALNLNPNYVEAWVRKGVTLLDIGEDYDAQVCLNKAVKLSPKSFKARYNRGKCLLKLKYYDEAILDFQQAVSIKPKHDGFPRISGRGFPGDRRGRISPAASRYSGCLARRRGYMMK